MDTEVNDEQEPTGIFADGYTLHPLTLTAEDTKYPALLMRFTNSSDDSLNTDIVFATTVENLMLFRTHINQACDFTILNIDTLEKIESDDS